MDAQKAKEGSDDSFKYVEPVTCIEGSDGKLMTRYQALGLDHFSSEELKPKEVILLSQVTTASEAMDITLTG
jgi:hypothetical protein